MNANDSSLPILIVGGGIGGLAAALAFVRQGFYVKVLEQAPEIGEIGAGIQLGPNAFHAFDALGVQRLELFHAVGNPISCQVATRAGFATESVVVSDTNAEAGAQAYLYHLNENSTYWETCSDDSSATPTYVPGSTTDCPMRAKSSSAKTPRPMVRK